MTFLSLVAAGLFMLCVSLCAPSCRYSQLTCCRLLVLLDNHALPFEVCRKEYNIIYCLLPYLMLIHNPEIVIEKLMISVM